MQLEGTPLDLFKMLCQSYSVMVLPSSGTYFLRTYEEAHALDDQIGPLRAARIAAYKRELLAALVREGFTRAEAMKIVAADPTPAPEAIAKRVKREEPARK